MDCNRGEALRAKELAERKFSEKDYIGAMNLAMKAQNLFPSLEGVSQLITTLDVYLASEGKVNGEKDWYAVLHVSASADEETVKKQYRKLALLLHPDKNKSAGAEGAFQIVSEAWSVLSDKSKKMVYDQKISVEGFQQTASQSSKNTSVPCATTNGSYQFYSGVAEKTKKQQRNSHKPQSAPPPPHSTLPTFWTSCAGCCMQYEYHRVYLNKSLLCPKCKKPFLATELASPPTGLNPTRWSFKQQKQQIKHKNSNSSRDTGASGLHQGQSAHSFSNSNFQWAANVSHPTHENAKRQREEAEAAVKREETLRRKLSGQPACSSVNNHAEHGDDKIGTARTGTVDDTTDSNVGDQVDPNVECSRNTVPEGGKGTWFYNDSRRSSFSGRRSNLYTEYAQVDVRAMLVEKAKVGILKKLREFNLAEAAKAKDFNRVIKKKRPKDGKGSMAIDTHNVKYKVQRKHSNVRLMDDYRTNNQRVRNMGIRQSNGNDNSNKEAIHTLSIDVPDPHFFDFDSERTEKTFAADQVWATYDDDDGMPRYYAFIQKVISSKPFRVRMSFLTSKSNAEFSPLNWVSSGFSKTTGDFRVGRYVIINTINIFSHRVKWEKGFRGVIKVFPRKGDIWALYRNWNPNWNEHTTDDVIHKYEMVEVLEEYNENKGILVVPLVKVAGFRTIFLRHMEPTANKIIPKEEMFRFSHRVPSYLLTGHEAHNAPKDCFELDPAATPLELLQVLTETKDEGLMNDAEKQLT